MECDSGLRTSSDTCSDARILFINLSTGGLSPQESKLGEQALPISPVRPLQLSKFEVSALVLPLQSIELPSFAGAGDVATHNMTHQTIAAAVLGGHDAIHRANSHTLRFIVVAFTFHTCARVDRVYAIDFHDRLSGAIRLARATYDAFLCDNFHCHGSNLHIVHRRIYTMRLQNPAPFYNDKFHLFHIASS